MPRRKLWASIAATDLIRNIDSGIMGSSAHRHSTRMKAIRQIPPTTNMAIIMGESHGESGWPPSEMGINSRITAAVPKNKPSTSIFATVSLRFNLGIFEGSQIQLQTKDSIARGEMR